MEQLQSLRWLLVRDLRLDQLREQNQRLLPADMRLVLDSSLADEACGGILYLHTVCLNLLHPRRL